MSVDSKELIEADNERMALEDDNADSTGTLLLTVDCYEEPLLLPKRKANKPTKARGRTRKKGNLPDASATSPKNKRNMSADGPKERKKKTDDVKNVVVQLDEEGQKRYSCTLCKKTYTQASTLRTHMRLHMGERPYSCSLCGNTFVQTGHLTSHMRTHTGIRPHACGVCDKRFGATGDLKVTVHLARISESTLNCDLLIIVKFVPSSNIKITR